MKVSKVHFLSDVTKCVINKIDVYFNLLVENNILVQLKIISFGKLVQIAINKITVLSMLPVYFEDGFTNQKHNGC